MEFRLCCAVIIAMVLTMNCNIYAIPLSEILSGQSSGLSSESQELSSEDLSTENSTVNGTKKDL